MGVQNPKIQNGTPSASAFTLHISSRLWSAHDNEQSDVGSSLISLKLVLYILICTSASAKSESDSYSEHSKIWLTFHTLLDEFQRLFTKLYGPGVLLICGRGIRRTIHKNWSVISFGFQLDKEGPDLPMLWCHSLESKKSLWCSRSQISTHIRQLNTYRRSSNKGLSNWRVVE